MEIKKIAIVDIETTNFLNRGGLIVEVGICELDLKTGKIKKLFDKIVKEKEFSKLHKNSWVFKNTTLKFTEVNKAKSLAGSRKKIQSIFDKYYCTAFNKNFDFSFFRNRKFIIKKELDCPMLIATNIIKLPGRFGNFKWPSVIEAINFYCENEEEYDESHRGYQDAVDEAGLIYEMYKRGDFVIEE